jgi:predicted kinase
MKHLILIRGLPGSGKSTLAKLYESAYFEHFEADMWFEGKTFDPKNLKEAHTWCQNKAKALMLTGGDLVVSNTFVRLWEMQWYIDCARDNNYRIQLIECKGNFGSIHNVPEEKITQMRANWENI